MNNLLTRQMGRKRTYGHGPQAPAGFWSYRLFGFRRLQFLKCQFKLFDLGLELFRRLAELCGKLGDDGLRRAAYRGW